MGRTDIRAVELIDRVNLVQASYHQLDLALARYLGSPCSNFFTYAKHAAREAGVQAVDADTAIDLVSSRPSVRGARALLRRPDIVAKATALLRANRSRGAVLDALRTLRRGLDVGNVVIYEQLAPPFFDFAAGRPPRLDHDVNGLLAAGLAHYERARTLSLQASSGASSEQARSELRVSAREALRAGNDLVVFHEQLYIAQPFYDEMRSELAALDGLLSLHHPGGVHRLSRGWADFHQRMGLDPRGAPADPRRIGPSDFPLARSLTPGTIADYFDGNLENPRLHLPPPLVGRR